MFIYRIKLDLACKIKLEHIEFYVTKYLREVTATGYFNSCSLEMDVYNNVVIIEKQCSSIGNYHDYIKTHEQLFLKQISSNIGSDLLGIEKYFTKTVHLINNHQLC